MNDTIVCNHATIHTHRTRNIKNHCKKYLQAYIKISRPFVGGKQARRRKPGTFSEEFVARNEVSGVPAQSSGVSGIAASFATTDDAGNPLCSQLSLEKREQEVTRREKALELRQVAFEKDQAKYAELQKTHDALVLAKKVSEAKTKSAAAVPVGGSVRRIVGKARENVKKAAWRKKKPVTHASVDSDTDVSVLVVLQPAKRRKTTDESEDTSSDEG